MKKKTASFRIKRTTLSQSCRNNIKSLFQDKRIKCDVPGLLNQIDLLLPAFDVTCQKTEEVVTAKTKEIKRQVRNLLSVVTTLHADTRQMLDKVYEEINKPPKYHGLWAEPVDEFMERLMFTCELIERDWRPHKGAPANRERTCFTIWLMDIFERWTKTKATASPSAVFDSFLGCVLEDVAGEPAGPSRRKLIESAMAGRKQMKTPASMEEVISACELLKREWGNKYEELHRRWGHKAPFNHLVYSVHKAMIAQLFLR